MPTPEIVKEQGPPVAEEVFYQNHCRWFIIPTIH
jgi:hypothetical protein